LLFSVGIVSLSSKKKYLERINTMTADTKSLIRLDMLTAYGLAGRKPEGRLFLLDCIYMERLLYVNTMVRNGAFTQDEADAFNEHFFTLPGVAPVADQLLAHGMIA